MAHPSDAVDHLLVRVLLDSRQNGPKLPHSNKSSAAFSRFLAGVVYSAPCHPLLDPPITASLVLDKDATFVPTDAVKLLWTGDFVMLEFAHVH